MRRQEHESILKRELRTTKFDSTALGIAIGLFTMGMIMLFITSTFPEHTREYALGYKDAEIAIDKGIINACDSSIPVTFGFEYEGRTASVKIDKCGYKTLVCTQDDSFCIEYYHDENITINGVKNE